MEIRKEIKPLSVNQAWQGQRFKTPKYKVYEAEVFYSLPNKKMPEPPYEIHFEFGFSNVLSDLDNPVKVLQDILCKKYKFDDRDIFYSTVRKVKVNKGKEYFKVKIETLTKE